MIKACKNCRWLYKKHCSNGESEKCIEIVSSDDSCNKWGIIEQADNVKNAIEDIRSMYYEHRNYRSAIFKKDGLPFMYTGSFKLAISALENQIDRQPSIESFIDIMRKQRCYKVKCPKCGERFFTLEFINDKDRRFTEFGEWLKNCYNCGQSLDWGVGE